MKVLIVVNCWCVGKLRGLCLTHFSSYLIYFSFVYGSCKRIKDGRKETRIPLNSNFILEFMTILWCGMFSWTSKHCCSSQTRCWNILWNHFSTLRVREVYLAEAATSRSHNLPLSSELGKHVCYLPIHQGKKVPSRGSDNRLLRKNFSLASRNPSSKACADFASCQRPPGNLQLFLIYLFYFFFLSLQYTGYIH